MSDAIAESEILVQQRSVERADCGVGPNGIPRYLKKFSVQPNQILVWIGVCPAASTRTPQQGPRLPAIVDTGCNSCLTVNRTQFEFLTESAAPTELFKRNVHSVGARMVATVYCNLSLLVYPMHANAFVPTGSAPTRLFLGDVTVYERTGGTLPLFGLPSIVQNGLHLHVDGRGRRARLFSAGNLELQPADVNWR